MTGKGEGRAKASLRPRGLFLLMTGLALAGCGSLGDLGGAGPIGAPAGAASAQAAARSSADLEAPEVFRVAEAGLWDGRPSLGGIWVAHPDVTDPERVRIVNRANGQEVVGALFRRERELPGPALQVSSDAAEALGMLAGAPAELEVVALRRQEAPPEPAAADTTAAEAAAPDDAAEEAPAATSADIPAAEAPPAEVAAAEPPPAESAPPAPPVDPAALEALAQATAAILAGAAPAPQAGAIATTTLDAAPALDASSALQRPYVQLATFESQANADAAAAQIAAQSLPVTVFSTSGGAWRLLLGPATTEAQQAALLQGAVAAGFADAYLVSS